MDANETLVMLLAVGVSAFYAIMVFVASRRRSAPSEPRVVVGRPDRRAETSAPPGSRPAGG